MNWVVLAPIIAEYGLPFAEKLWRLVSSGTAPTQADWDELRKLSRKTPRSKMEEALVGAGIDLSSEQAKALLAMTES